MTPGIMSLDVFELRRLSESRYIPIQVPQPFMQRWIPAPYIPDIAFEVLNIDGIEAYNSCVQANVGLGDHGAEIVRGSVLCQVDFCAVKGFKESLDGFFVGLLCSILF